MGAGYLETSLNHRHFVEAHRYRMPLRAQTPERASSMIDVCAGTCVSKSSESKSQLDGHASHCCTARLITLAIGRLRALLKHS